MTKWTAPAFFYGTAIPFLWWRGRLRTLWSWQHLLSALVGGGIGAGLDRCRGRGNELASVLRHCSPRGAQSSCLRGIATKATRGATRFCIRLRCLATMLPWSVVGLLALRPSFMRLWDERGRFLLQALHCWAWPNLLFWSLAPEHAMRQSAPLFPALSGLAAMVCLAWSRGSARLEIAQASLRRGAGRHVGDLVARQSSLRRSCARSTPGTTADARQSGTTGDARSHRQNAISLQSQGRRNHVLLRARRCAARRSGGFAFRGRRLILYSDGGRMAALG